MKPPGYGISFQDVQRYDWQAVLESFERRHENYKRPQEFFFRESKSLLDGGDAVGGKVFGFLGDVMSLWPTFESSAQPFRAYRMRGANPESASMEDFSTDDALVLAQLSQVAKDPEVKARLADVSNALKFDHNLVGVAVEAYLEKARRIERCEKWVSFISDLERAAKLASKLGTQKPLFGGVMQYVQDLIAKFESVDVGLCCCRLMELLQAYGQGDAPHYASISEALAERAEAGGHTTFARSYWEVAAGWHKRAKAEAEWKMCEIRAAETYVLDAEAALKRSPVSYMSSSGHLAQAVNALQRADAPKERVEGIHRLLLQHQGHVHKEMGMFGTKIEIGDLPERAAEFVRGLSLRDAVFRLVAGVDLTNVQEHRKRIVRTFNDNPMMAMMPTSKVGRDGRTVAHRPSALTSDPEQFEKAVLAEMFHEAAQLDFRFRVDTFIEPCRLQIWREHNPQIRDLDFLVGNNAFVPPGHERSFARGFYAGFEGDWLEAAYFLAPQVENSIRYVLANHGVITSKLNDTLIQEVRMLHKLLDLPETVHVFGEALVFELRCSLTEEFGSNLRNRIAHGLMTDGDCYLPATQHLWWLLMRLCAISVMGREGDEQS